MFGSLRFFRFVFQVKCDSAGSQRCSMPEGASEGDHQFQRPGRHTEPSRLDTGACAKSLVCGLPITVWTFESFPVHVAGFEAAYCAPAAFQKKAPGVSARRGRPNESRGRRGRRTVRGEVEL